MNIKVTIDGRQCRTILKLLVKYIQTPTKVAKLNDKFIDPALKTFDRAHCAIIIQLTKEIGTNWQHFQMETLEKQICKKKKKKIYPAFKTFGFIERFKENKCSWNC
jgi:hypothetical protein